MQVTVPHCAMDGQGGDLDPFETLCQLEVRNDNRDLILRVVLRSVRRGSPGCSITNWCRTTVERIVSTRPIGVSEKIHRCCLRQLGLIEFNVPCRSQKDCRCLDATGIGLCDRKNPHVGIQREFLRAQPSCYSSMRSDCGLTTPPGHQSSFREDGSLRVSLRASRCRCPDCSAKLQYCTKQVATCKEPGLSSG